MKYRTYSLLVGLLTKNVEGAVLTDDSYAPDLVSCL